jgi:hypothetical protein
MVEPFRLEPAAPAAAMQTFTVSAPLSTHFRPGTCGEAGCQAHEHGWRTVVDETTDLGQRQAHYIRTKSGRHFTEERDPSGTAFTFPAGEQCFATHQVSLERPELYVVRGGDWRGNPTGEVRRHTAPEFWVEEFAENLDNVKATKEKG